MVDDENYKRSERKDVVEYARAFIHFGPQIDLSERRGHNCGIQEYTTCTNPEEC